MNWIPVFIFLVIPFSNSFVLGQSEIPSTTGLQDETMLHPSDAFTAHLFEKGELAYNQALTPYPSWGWWGITNWLTAELDFEAWIGGVPSLNFRVGIISKESGKMALAFETMYQFISNEVDILEDNEKLRIQRSGNSWYNRINASWNFNIPLFLHASAGLTYSQNLMFENLDNSNSVTYKDLLSPDLSLALDWRMYNWISLHSTASYGSTFLYVDNVPKKEQVTVGTRIAPMLNSKSGFLNSFRFEVSVISFYFPDVDQRITGPSGFLYWQWKPGKN